jgi:YfiH family protein
LGESLLRQDSNRLVTYRFESLAVEGLVHAVFTRLGGASRGPFATLNVGHTVGDDETAVAENHARIFSHLGLTCDRVVTARQVHGNRVAVVTAGDAGRVIPTTDGLVTDTPGLALMLRFADCQPILLYDPVHHALGLIHAGWRGVAEGIAYRAVETMQAAFGSRPQELLAGLGPAIGSCCYTVGHKVAAVMGYALPDWSQVMSLEGRVLFAPGRQRPDRALCRRRLPGGPRQGTRKRIFSECGGNPCGCQAGAGTSPAPTAVS